MRKYLRLAALSFVVGLLPAVTRADILEFRALQGITVDQEIPTHAPTGQGTGFSLYNTETLILFTAFTWDGLSDITVAHVHCCSGPAANGPVAVNLAIIDFPSGTDEIFTDLSLAASYGAGFLAGFGGDVDLAREAVLEGMSGGLAYYNFHTVDFPSGDIRGNITQVPEPSSLGLLGLALCAAGLLRRRGAGASKA
ncbi:CHRD domain-containing protein [Niveibacterium sp. SC-1]|uniref:CHRD domain-containing protein n=1 Tax=Niveibacterium sp. SC-1 TaxID=3135646 RepID=UPI00311D4E8D